MDRPNLGLTVNGLPLDDGAGLWSPDFFNPTSRDARVTARWGNVRQNTAATAVKVTKTGKCAPPPTKEEMLARMRAGKG